MSRELAVTFFPVTFGEVLKDHAPGLFYYVFPDWALERCPMPSVDLQVPGFSPVTLFWPAAATVIIFGFLSSLLLGTRSFLRVLREGRQSRQGLFLWSASLLWYSCMCIGGLFFHCLHIYHFPHILDLVGTGLSGLSVVAGFAAFVGVVDDRTGKQRLGWLGFAVAFVVVEVMVPPLLQEQLYVLPALLAAAVGAQFVWKSNAKLLQQLQAGGKVAQRWLWLGALGVILALGVVPMDNWLCSVGVISDFGLLFWFFLGCDIAILSTHQFALVVADKNLHFTNVKTHEA